jgi:membrane protein DedA with SNARE-associated domain
MAEWVIEVIERYGYLGIAALMLAENLFPPLPSELIVPFAGFLAARGDLHPALVVATGAAGSVVGALPWYVAGRKLGSARVRRWAERHGRWFTMKPDDVDRAERWFREHGVLVLVFGRLIPAVRTVVALPAGVACVPPLVFGLCTLAGSVLWCGVLTAAGYGLESQYERIARWLNPVSTAILALVVVTYAVRVIRYRPA